MQTESPFSVEPRPVADRKQRSEPLPPPPPTPPSIPNYRIIAFLGQGGFGTVWLAEQCLTGVRRAVKVLPKAVLDAKHGAMREIAGIRHYMQAVRGHPGLLQIYDVGETDGVYYYAMELADAAAAHGVSTDGDGNDGYQPMTLALLIHREAPMPPARAFEIMSQILRALQHLHDHGLMHRDVKPANILIVDGKIKLGDMGLVTNVDRDVTVVGTSGYVPWWDDKFDQTADLYACGIILYEMITGYHRDRFPVLPVPQPMDRRQRRDYRTAVRVINQAARRERKERYQTAAAMLRDIASRRVMRFPPPKYFFFAGVATILFIAVLSMMQTRSGPAASGTAKPPPIVTLTSAVVREVLGGPSYEVLLMYSDDEKRHMRFDDPVKAAAAFDILDRGSPQVIVAFDNLQLPSGMTMVFDALEFRKTGNQTPVDRQQISAKLPAHWKHQKFDSVYNVNYLRAVDLNRDRKQELLAIVSYPQGPTCLMLLGQSWERQGEYWHYGHIGLRHLIDLNADTLPELICSGYANQRDFPYPFKAQFEIIHCCILVLDPRQLFAKTGDWSMNAWMNSLAPSMFFDPLSQFLWVKPPTNERLLNPPLKYGYVTMPGNQDSGGGWGGTDDLAVQPALEWPFHLPFKNGWLLEIDRNFNPKEEIRKNRADADELDPVPSGAQLWVKVLPAEHTPGNFVKEEPSAGE